MDNDMYETEASIDTLLDELWNEPVPIRDMPLDFDPEA